MVKKAYEKMLTITDQLGNVLKNYDLIAIISLIRTAIKEAKIKKCREGCRQKETINTVGGNLSYH